VRPLLVRTVPSADGCEDCSLTLGGSTADLSLVGISGIMSRSSLAVDSDNINCRQFCLSVP